MATIKFNVRFEYMNARTRRVHSGTIKLAAWGNEGEFTESDAESAAHDSLWDHWEDIGIENEIKNARFKATRLN